MRREILGLNKTERIQLKEYMKLSEEDLREFAEKVSQEKTLNQNDLKIIKAFEAELKSNKNDE